MGEGLVREGRFSLLPIDRRIFQTLVEVDGLHDLFRGKKKK